MNEEGKTVVLDWIDMEKLVHLQIYGEQTPFSYLIVFDTQDFNLLNNLNDYCNPKIFNNNPQIKFFLSTTLIISL